MVGQDRYFTFLSFSLDPTLGFIKLSALAGAQHKDNVVAAYTVLHQSTVKSPVLSTYRNQYLLHLAYCFNSPLLDFYVDSAKKGLKFLSIVLCFAETGLNFSMYAVLRSFRNCRYHIFYILHVAIPLSWLKITTATTVFAQLCNVYGHEGVLTDTPTFTCTWKELRSDTKFFVCIASQREELRLF